MGEKINNFVKSFNTKLSELVKKQVESDNEYKKLRDIAIKNTNIKIGKWPDTDPNIKTLGNLIGYVFPESRFSNFNEPPALTSNTPNPLYMDFITDLKSDKTIYDLYNQLKKLRGIKNYVEYERKGGGQFWFDTFMYVFNKIVSKDDNFIKRSVDEIKKNTGNYVISRFDNKIKEGLWMANYGKKTSDYGDYIVFYSYLINENDLNNYRPIELSLINLAVERDGLPDNEDVIIKVENKDKRNSDLLYQAFLEAGDSYSGPNTKKIEDLNSEPVKEQLKEANKIEDKKAILEEVPKAISGTPSLVTGTTSTVDSNNTSKAIVAQNGYLTVNGKYSTIYIPDIPKNYSTVISSIIFYPSDLINSSKKDKPSEYKDYETYKLSTEVKTDFFLRKENPSLKTTKDLTGVTYSVDLYKDKILYGKFGKEEWGEIILDSASKGFIKKNLVSVVAEYNSMYETLLSIIPEWFKKYVISIPVNESVDIDRLKAELNGEVENKYIKSKDLNIVSLSTSINYLQNKLSDFKNVGLVDPFVTDWQKLENSIDDLLKLKKSDVYLVYYLGEKTISGTVSTGTMGTSGTSGTAGTMGTSGTSGKSNTKSKKTSNKSNVVKESSKGKGYDLFVKEYGLKLSNKISSFESNANDYIKARIEALKINDPYVDSTGKQIDYPSNCKTIGEAFSNLFPENTIGKPENLSQFDISDKENIQDLLNKYPFGGSTIYNTLNKFGKVFSYLINLYYIKEQGLGDYWIDLFYSLFYEYITEIKISEEDIKKIDYFNKLRTDKSFSYFISNSNAGKNIEPTLSNSFVSDVTNDYIKTKVLHDAFLDLYTNRNKVIVNNNPSSKSGPIAEQGMIADKTIESIHQNIILNKGEGVVSKSEYPLTMLSEFFISFSSKIEKSLTTFQPSSDTDENRAKGSVLDGDIKCELKIVGLDINNPSEGFHYVVKSGEELPDITVELHAIFNEEDEFKLSKMDRPEGLDDEYLEDDYSKENTNINEKTGELYSEADLAAYQQELEIANEPEPNAEDGKIKDKGSTQVWTTPTVNTGLTVPTGPNAYSHNESQGYNLTGSKWFGNLLSSALAHIDHPTFDIPKTENGNMGCASWVSMVFYRAFGVHMKDGSKVVDKPTSVSQFGSLGTIELGAWFKQNPNMWEKINWTDGQPGDIINTERSSKPGHIGVVLNEKHSNGTWKIASNSSRGFGSKSDPAGCGRKNYDMKAWQSVTNRNPSGTFCWRYKGPRA